MDSAEIKSYVATLVKQYGTADPFSLAEKLNIIVFDVPLGELQGFYMYLKKHRTIFINSDIEDFDLRRVVLAHEIGHAMLHTKVNNYFMKKNTFLNTSKYEIQANRFAAELLISDELIENNSDLTSAQLARLARVSSALIEYKLSTYN